MPLIKESCIDAIKQASSLKDVVERYGVQLKRSGSNWKGLSPFNPEKTESFYVLEDKQIFKCFSSGHGGNVFRFVELMENIPFPEAVSQLAQWGRIPLEYENTSKAQVKTHSLRQELFHAQELAMAFFREQFKQNSGIQAYWTQERQFSLETAEEWGIGYAPAAPEVLIQALLPHGLSKEALLGCGLFYQPRYEDATARDLRARFRGRLMIPIRDLQARVVGFTGRQSAFTPETDPTQSAKYINSPETLIFQKGKLLFALDRARKQKNLTSLLLVEGQLDAIRLHSVGIEQAIAPQGTAITPEQIQLIKRYSDQIDCFLDGDAAGKRAAEKLLTLAFETGLQVRFLLTQEGQDPDSLIRQYGKIGFEHTEKKALPCMQFFQQIHLPDKNQAHPNQKSSALRALFELIHRHPSQVLQQDYLSAFARESLLDPSSIHADYQQFARQAKRSVLSNVQTEVSKKTKKEDLTNSEFDLLYILLHNEGNAKEFVSQINLDWLDPSNPFGSLLHALLSEQMQSDGVVPDFTSLSGLSEDQNALIVSILAQKKRFEDSSRVFDEAIKALQMRYYKKRLKQINEAIVQSDNHNKDQLLELQLQRKSLRAELSRLVS